jgi:uncharacterized repeat protein (TIGR01451 family)
VTATFLLEATNLGPSTATNVVITDVLPDGVTFVSASFSDGSDTYDPVTGLCTVGTLAVDETATLTIVVTAHASIDILNRIEVVSSDQPDQDLRNNIAGAKLGRGIPDIRRLRADLSLTKTVDNETPSVGSTVLYTIVVGNGGPYSTAGVEVQDVLPDGLEFVSATITRSDSEEHSTPLCCYDAETGMWELGPLRMGETATLVIEAEVIGTGEITNAASIIGGNLPDPDSDTRVDNFNEDDQDTAVITVASAKTTGLQSSSDEIPESVELGTNYPNPFNPETVIPFGLPERSHVRLAVYSVLGRLVEVLLDEDVAAGRHRVTWKADNLPTGVYLVRLQAGSVQQVQRVTLVK